LNGIAVKPSSRSVVCGFQESRFTAAKGKAARAKTRLDENTPGRKHAWTSARLDERAFGQTP
jgi:hypothetical protein